MGEIWSDEYLVSLCQKFYGAEPGEKIVSVKEGEIVSLKMEQSRFTCPLARILRLYPGKNSCKGTKNS